MPSNPSHTFENDVLRNISRAHYTDQYDPATRSNQPAATRTSRTPLHSSHAATSSRASSSYDSFHCRYESDIVPQTQHSFNSQHDLNRRLIPPPANTQSQIAPMIPPQRPLVETHYFPREPPDTVIEHGCSGLSVEYAATGTRMGDIQPLRTPNQTIVTPSPVNRFPRSLMPKRKRGEGASGSAKRLCGNQRELSISSSTSNESDQGRHSSFTEEGFTHWPHELVSSGGTPSGHSRSPSKSAVVQGARSEPSDGFFAHSSNNVIHQPIMVDNSQHNHGQVDQPDGTLLWLKDYIMEGAEFDSSKRDPPPRCHPNTRTSIIERMLGWIKDPRREKKMRWVRGTAGVGKSAIVQTVFESLPKELQGGSVFFSKPNGRNNPNEVFPSIAYQLAVRNSSYRAYLKELMLEDPRSLCKSMKEQFRILFEEPFANQKLLDGQTALVIALDGLDECGGDPNYGVADPARSHGRSSESAQRKIVESISTLIQQHASVPLIWVIASRPEKHLQVTFASEKVQSIFLEEEVPVDSVEACRDVEKYLNSEFTRIQKDHDDLMPTTPWPSSKDFSLITTKASGLFIFAQVVIRFIDDANPIEQLKYALAAISKASAAEVENPLVFLDAMYMEIVSRVPLKLLEPATKIIGTIVLLDQKGIRKADATLPSICNILDISKDVALTALRHLHSVLFFPKVIVSTRPRFYHASFRDFLEDESRSHEYSINEVKIGDALAEGLMRFHKKESLDDSTLPWPRARDSHQFVQMAQIMFSTKTPNFPLLFIRDLVAGLSGVSPRNFAIIRWILETFPDFPLPRKQEQLGIVCRRPMDSLGATRDTVSECLIIFRVDFYIIFLNEPRSASESKDIVALRELICCCIEVEPLRHVTVWGREQFTRFAVFPLLFNLFLHPRLEEHLGHFHDESPLVGARATAVICC